VRKVIQCNGDIIQSYVAIKQLNASALSVAPRPTGIYGRINFSTVEINA
jgi:hypothetical protein